LELCGGRPSYAVDHLKALDTPVANAIRDALPGPIWTQGQFLPHLLDLLVGASKMKQLPLNINIM